MGECSTLTKQSIISSLRLREYCPIGGMVERMQELGNKAKSMKQYLLVKTQSYRCLHWSVQGGASNIKLWVGEGLRSPNSYCWTRVLVRGSAYNCLHDPSPPSLSGSFKPTVTQMSLVKINGSQNQTKSLVAEGFILRGIKERWDESDKKGWQGENNHKNIIYLWNYQITKLANKKIWR